MQRISLIGADTKRAVRTHAHANNRLRRYCFDNKHLTNADILASVKLHGQLAGCCSQRAESIRLDDGRRLIISRSVGYGTAADVVRIPIFYLASLLLNERVYLPLYISMLLPFYSSRMPPASMCGSSFAYK